mgnify:CR=1 FL=1
MSLLKSREIILGLAILALLALIATLLNSSLGSDDAAEALLD